MCEKELRQILSEADLGVYHDKDLIFVCLDCWSVFDGKVGCEEHRNDYGPDHAAFARWDRADDCVERYNVDGDDELELENDT